jgi:hypothetical protein
VPTVSLLLSQGPEKSNAHFSLPFAAAYPRDYRLDHLSPMDEVRTLILTQSSLPLIQFWGGRLQLEAFQSTLHIQNGQLGPPAMAYADLSSRGTKLSRRAAFGPSLWPQPQPQLSLWPRRANRPSGPAIAASNAHGGRRSELNSVIALTNPNVCDAMCSLASAASTVL